MKKEHKAYARAYHERQDEIRAMKDCPKLLKEIAKGINAKIEHTGGNVYNVTKELDNGQFIAICSDAIYLYENRADYDDCGNGLVSIGFYQN